MHSKMSSSSSQVTDTTCYPGIVYVDSAHKLAAFALGGVGFDYLQGFISQSKYGPLCHFATILFAAGVMGQLLIAESVIQLCFIVSI